VSKKIYLVPLGCPKNQVDGELMLGRAKAEGHVIVDDPAQADVLVVNTCGFIDAAREESVDRILELAGVKARRSDCRLVVTGCMAERYSDELAAELPEIDAFVGTGAIDRFTEAIVDPIAEGPRVFKGEKHYLPSATMERLLGSADGSAYVKVSEGCDHECSFCIIPSIRGRHESRAIEDVVAEADRLAASGIVEINLVAQDLSAYGKDLGIREGLAALLHRLGRIAGLERVRCFYLYPNTLTDAALDAIREVENVCPYIDMPLQHADPEILRQMRRGRDTDQLRRTIDRIRTRVPDAALRTSFIVGFPGESEAAFENLCRFVEETRFDRVGVFTYSVEEGSAAALLPGRVPAALAERRRDQLMALQEPISEVLLEKQIGTRQRVLVCARDDDGNWYGRTPTQAPEVDGVTYLSGSLETWKGRCIDALITGSDAHDLFADSLV